jgi:uncharacterized protein (TIGR03067 family)
MFRLCLLALVVLAGWRLPMVDATDKPQDEAAQELKKLQGEWELHGDEVDGRLSRAMLDRAIPFTSAYSVKGEQLVVTGTHGETRWTLTGMIKLMPTSSPKGIDFAYETTAAEKLVTLRGVYELKEDRLRICWAKTGSEKRPDRLDAKTGDGSITHVYLRSERKKSKGE